MISPVSAKPFFRWSELETRYGRKLLARLLAAGWLTPAVRRHRYSIYAAASVAAVDARLTAGEFPVAGAGSVVDVKKLHQEVES